MYGARQASDMADGRPHTFLTPKLAAPLTSTDSVSSALAITPTKAVHEVAEALYGKRHGSAHHSLAADEAKEGNTDKEKSGGLTKVMEKLHLMKTKTEADATAEGKEKHDKDRKNPAADQWLAMRRLSEGELREVAGYGNWGNAQPGELFLNVSLMWPRCGRDADGTVLCADATCARRVPAEWHGVAVSHRQPWRCPAQHRVCHPGYHPGMHLALSRETG